MNRSGEAELGSLTLPPTIIDTAGMIGMVTMTRALIAAADQRPGDVAAPMQTAKELAAQFGEPDDNHDHLGFGFGPTNVGLWEMALELEVGDSEPDRAVSVSRPSSPSGIHSRRASRNTGWTTAERWPGCGAPGTTLCGRCAPPRSCSRCGCSATRSLGMSSVSWSRGLGEARSGENCGD